MKVLIIEDEEHSASKLSRYLTEIDDTIQIVGLLSSVRAGIEFLKTNQEPDLIFLDIHLSDGESFKIFERVTVDSYVIVLTAYDHYAIQAFDLNTVGYVLKPFTKESIVTGLNKFERSRLNRHNLMQSASRHQRKYLSRLIVKKGLSYRTLQTKAVSHFVKEQVVILVTMENEKFVYEATLDELEAMLDPDDFFRINRQTIIHYDSISSFVPTSSHRYEVKLKTMPADPFVVSQGKVADFKRWIVR